MKKKKKKKAHTVPFHNFFTIWYYGIIWQTLHQGKAVLPTPQVHNVISQEQLCCRYVCLAVCSLSLFLSLTHITFTQCAIWFGLLLHDWGIFRTMALHVPLPHSYNHHPPFNSFILSNSISNQFQKKCSTNNHCTLFWQESLQITLYN